MNTKILPPTLKYFLPMLWTKLSTQSNIHKLSHIFENRIPIHPSSKLFAIPQAFRTGMQLILPAIIYQLFFHFANYYLWFNIRTEHTLQTLTSTKER